MSLPDDFGLGPVRTLAHVAEGVPAPMHQAFWRAWRDALFAHEPGLRVADAGECDDPSASHIIESVGGVRLGCRLLLPAEGGALRAMLVSLHGYGEVPSLADHALSWSDLGARGVAVLAVRVRGFRGSRMDASALADAAARGGWVAHGLDQPIARPADALRWSVPQAALDVACALRVARRELTRRAGPEAMLQLHGESFGGGLAVLAIAGLARRIWVERLVLSLPSLGDWAWRSRHGRWGEGLGAELGALLRGQPAREQELYDTIRLCDSAVLAPQVSCAVLGKLAERDEVVPAPSAAAVFNALGADPGRKYRFVVPVGHADAGAASARRHALFRRCAADFLDPARRARDGMRAWAALLGAGDPEEGAEQGVPEQGVLFAAAVPGEVSAGSASRVSKASPGPEQDSALIAAYERGRRTLDDLPYTEEFEQVRAVARASGLSDREAFSRLHNLRKAGRLPRLGQAASYPPRLEPAEELVLRDLVTEAVGSLGMRDRLPFTPEFDHVVEVFNARTGRALSMHDAWRVIAKLAK